MRGEDEQALRYAKLARELGLSSGSSDGMSATVAMRRGQWDEAKRLLLAQGEVPDEFKPNWARYVDAIADPAQRPAMVAKLRAVDPKVARQVDLVQPYLQLGQTDLVYQIIDDTLDAIAWPGCTR